MSDTDSSPQSSLKKRTLSRLEALELFMLLLVVLLFIFVLILQSRIVFFDQIKSQLILTDVLIASAIVILFGKFLLDFYKVKFTDILQRVFSFFSNKRNR